MDLHKSIKRSFSVSKALGKAGVITIAVGSVLLLAGYAASFHVDKLETKLRTNKQ